MSTRGAASALLVVARVRRPHGVRGEVLIAIDTDRPDWVFVDGRTLMLGDGRGEPLGRRMSLRGFRPTPTGAIARFEGIEDREGAERLRGHTLLIRRDQAAPTEADEIHYQDLVGMEVTGPDGEIGSIEDVLEMPVGEVLVVRTIEGREVLLPFVREIVEEVDAEARRVSVRLPEGILDL